MQKRKFLSPSEVRALLDAALDGPHPERNHCLIMMTWYHGLRASEALRLQLSDIDISGRTLFVRRLKNSFSTVQPVLPGVSLDIENYCTLRLFFVLPGCGKGY
ncbi:TPA: tyrosine-type recombinase/integrase [Salmonella enterica]|nr:tyrosine-type recombinase/integrase [Salmonella enterica]